MPDKKIAVVGIPGKWSTEVLAEAVREKILECPIIEMGDVCLNLERKQLRFNDIDLCTYDAIIVKKISASYCPATLDRLEMLRFAESRGVRVFSPALNMLRLIDRMSCTVTLANHGIAMPPTVITEDETRAIEAVHSYSSAVFKPLYSTKARGMQVINASDSQLVEKIKRFHQENPVMYIQKKLTLEKDFGMVFLGGNYLGTYARVKQGNSWNTTINSGGKYQLHDPPQSTIDLAYQAQKPFQMDFTTVDVADTESGPIVFEVSAFGGFRGAKEGIGIDVASLYVDYVLESLENGKK